MQGISLRNKTFIFTIAGVVLIAANVFCYGREFGRDLKTVDYSAAEQLLYHPSYAQEGFAPDAMIREIVRGRTVMVPRKVKPYSEYWSYTHMHDEWNPFSIDYFSENNYTKYMSEYAGEVVVDTTLPDLYELWLRPMDDDVKAKFTDLGRGHELMRYAFMGDHTDEETTNQFFYSYFYTSDSYYQRDDALNISICTEGLNEDDTLVALWDTSENLYLMSRSFYDREMKADYMEELTIDESQKNALYNQGISEGKNE
jgi:hypothetical protein